MKDPLADAISSELKRCRMFSVEMYAMLVLPAYLHLLFHLFAAMFGNLAFLSIHGSS